MKTKTDVEILEAKVDFLVEILDEKQLDEYIKFCEQL